MITAKMMIEALNKEVIKKDNILIEELKIVNPDPKKTSQLPTTNVKEKD